MTPVADHVVGGLHCDEASDLAAGFVLGALEPAEMAAVRAHIADCPEAHAEFVDLGSAVPALLESMEPAEPSAGLRDRILDAARREPRASVPAPATPAPRAITSAPSVVASRSFGPSRARPMWAALGIAAVLAVVVLGAWNLQLRATNDELAAYQQGVAAVVDAASQRGSQLAVLGAPRGTSGPAGLAAVRSDGVVAIAMRGLAPTTGSQVYEAWLVASNAAPVPIGGFRVGTSGSAALTDGQGLSSVGVVVALTLEPGPGATTPTLPIIASGAAQGRSD